MIDRSPRLPRLVEQIEVDEAGYLIHKLRRESAEEARLLSPFGIADREATLLRWLALSISVHAVVDADYLGRETERLLTEVRRFFDNELRRRFDPESDDSLTRPVLDHARDSQRNGTAAATSRSQ